MQKELINKKVWQEYAKTFSSGYVNIPPPFTPSRAHIKIYEKILRQTKNSLSERVLVLGCTPSLGDCLAKLKFKTTLLEFSPEMILSMHTLRRIKNKTEKVKIGLWTKVDKYFPAQAFDCVIGHAVTNNLANLRLYDAFFRAMQRILKSRGRLIITVVNSSPIQQSPEGLIKKIRRNPNYFKNLNNKIYAWEACISSDPRFYYKKKFLTVMNSLNVYFQKKLKRQEITEKEYQLLTFDWYNKPQKATYLPSKIFERLASKYFQILKKIKEPNRHPAFREFYTIYVLAPKTKNHCNL